MCHNLSASVGTREISVTTSHDKCRVLRCFHPWPAVSSSAAFSPQGSHCVIMRDSGRVGEPGGKPARRWKTRPQQRKKQKTSALLTSLVP